MKRAAKLIAMTMRHAPACGDLLKEQRRIGAKINQQQPVGTGLAGI